MTDPAINTSRPNVLGSRLGRSLLFRFWLIGLLPLLIFSLPLFLQTTSLLKEDTRSTLVGFTRLAKSQVFITLDRARSNLAMIAALPAGRERPPAPFLVLRSLTADLRPADGRAVPWPPLDDARRRFLAQERIAVTAPYRVEDAMTVSLIAPLPGGGFVAGELNPEDLWKVTQAGNFGEGDVLAILDAEGRILASSSSDLDIGTRILPGLPRASATYGDTPLAEIGRAVWSFSDLWLDGAFGGERWGVLVVRPESRLMELPFALLGSLLLLFTIAFCVIILLSFRSSRRLLAPIENLVQATTAVAGGEWNRRVDDSSPDELGDLGRAFNRMTRRLLASYEDRIRLSREAGVGRLANMVSHHINNPLTAMSVSVEMEIMEHPEHRALLEKLQTQLRRITRTVQAINAFARVRRDTVGRLNKADIVRNIETLCQENFTAQKVELSVRVEEAPYRLKVSDADFQELILHLLENARESCAEAGPAAHGEPPRGVRLAIRPHEGGMKILVEDDGKGLGMPLDELFEPFVTSKVQGFGLGLAICRRICDDAGGWIKAENRPSGGALFTVFLPGAPAEE